ncbi:MAG: hypothetical protein ACLU84_05390 [Clostridia bacterium]
MEPILKYTKLFALRDKLLEERQRNGSNKEISKKLDLIGEILRQCFMNGDVLPHHFSILGSYENTLVQSIFEELGIHSFESAYVGEALHLKDCQTNIFLSEETTLAG